MLQKKNKKLFVAGGIAIYTLLSILIFNVFSSSKADLKNIRVQQKELMALKDEFSFLKSKVDTVEEKKSLVKMEGVVKAIDEIFLPLGLKDKVKSVKVLTTKEGKDAVEEEAEVNVEKIDMNEMVNIFYMIENAPMILSLRSSNIKKSFENPSLLNITIKIALIKTK